jgi:hypothetical protein
VPGVLGGIEKHAASFSCREAPHAGRPRSDGDGEIGARKML